MATKLRTEDDYYRKRPRLSTLPSLQTEQDSLTTGMPDDQMMSVEEYIAKFNAGNDTDSSGIDSEGRALGVDINVPQSLSNERFYTTKKPLYAQNEYRNLMKANNLEVQTPEIKIEEPKIIGYKEDKLFQLGTFEKKKTPIYEQPQPVVNNYQDANNLYDIYEQEYAQDEPARNRVIGYGETTGEEGVAGTIGLNLLDLVGNTLWGIAEGFGGWVPDMAFGNTWSGAMGSDEWESESIGGKIGYTIGTGLSLLLGIGIVGKGLQGLSRAASAGVKLATKTAQTAIKSSSITSKITQEATERAIKDTRKLIARGQKDAVKSLKWGSRTWMNPMSSAKNAIMHNPLGDDIVFKKVVDKMDDVIKDAMKLTDPNEIRAIKEIIMKEASQSMNKHFGHSLSYTLQTKFPKLFGDGPLRAGAARLVGDIAYEAALLGIYESVLGEINDGMANVLGLEHSEDPMGGYHYENWYARVGHGMVTGSILAPIRYIPGGKQVVVGKSGMIADMNAARKILTARFFRSPAKMTDNQLKGVVQTLATSSNGAFIKEAHKLAKKGGKFASLSKLNQSFLRNNSTVKLTAENREVYEAAYNAVTSNWKGLMGRLSYEIARDGAMSFTRASVGSWAMNRANYDMMAANGLMPWQTELSQKAIDAGYTDRNRTPWDKFIFDHWIGMLYMKRGKSFKNSNGKPVYYESHKEGYDPINGSEIGRFVKAYETTYMNEANLEIYNRFALGNVSNALENLQHMSSVYDNVDVKNVVRKYTKDFVDPTEYVKIMEQAEKDGVDVRNWQYHARLESTNLRRTINEMEKNNAPKDQIDQVKDQYNKLNDAILMAESVGDIAHRSVGSGPKQGEMKTRPMTKVEALEFVEGFREFKLQDGTIVNIENFGVFDKIIKDGQLKITRDTQDVVLGFIYDSLEAVKLIDPSIVASKAPGAVISRSTIKSLETMISQFAGKNDKAYEAVYTLKEAIEEAAAKNIIKLSNSEGVKWDGTGFKQEAVEDLINIWEANTNSMHELVFNSISPEASWRNKVPTWEGTTEGYLDNNILASPPIWFGIETGHLHHRNKVVYSGFTGRNTNENAAEFYEFIQNKLGGAERFKVVADGVTTGEVLPAELTGLELQVLRNINSTLSTLGPNGGKGAKEIQYSEFLDIMKNTREFAGSLFENNGEFHAFERYKAQELVNDLLGTNRISTGLREAVLDIVSTENLISVKIDGSVKIRDSKAIQEMLMQNSQNMSQQQISHINDLIATYQKKIEIPLREVLSKGGSGLINFENIKIDTDLNNYNANDLMQNITELIFKADRGSLHALNDFSRTLMDLGVNIESLNANAIKVTGSTKISKELSEAMLDLKTANANLASLIDTYNTNNDVIGLRTLLDRVQVLNDMNKQLNANNGTDSKTLNQFAEKLNTFIDGVIADRNATLRLDDVAMIDAYIENKISHLKSFDRSGRHTKEAATTNPAEYTSKWGLPQDFVENLMQHPRKAINQINTIGGQLKALGLSSGKYRDLYENGIAEVLKGQFTIKDFTDIVLEPMIRQQKTIIESKRRLDKDFKGTYEEFVTETYQIFQRQLNSKKAMLGTYENGSLTIKETSVSGWDKGVNRLENALALNGSIIIMGQQIGVRGGYTTRVNADLLGKVQSELTGQGAFIELPVTEVMRTNDIALLESFKQIYSGTGKGGASTFIDVRLDEKTLILIPTNKVQNVANAWHFDTNPLRQKLTEVVSRAENISKQEASNVISEYFNQKLGKGINKNGELELGANPTADQVRSLVILTRLLEAPTAASITAVIRGNKSMESALSDMKYLKLDNSRSGLPLGGKSSEFALNFLPKFIEPGSPMEKVHEMFVRQVYGPVDVGPSGRSAIGVRNKSEDGTNKIRTLNVLDESGNGKQIFNSIEVVKRVAREQLKRENPDMTSSEIEQTINDRFLNKYKGMDASGQNGEKYLSLPEMVSMLFEAGAKPDWFIFNEAGDIVGFNKVIKPVEMHSRILPDGAMEFHIGKTAYKWHPVFDKLMQRGDGSYWIDAIGFGSTHKIHDRFDPSRPERGIFKEGYDPTAENLTGNFQTDMINNFSRGIAESHVMELDRSSILIKSISSAKDGTVSSGFTNLLSHQANKALNNVTKVNDNVGTLQQQFNDLSKSPFAFKNLALQLRNYNKHSGDNISGLVGVEAVLAANGLPVFEYMMPHVEKMVISEYTGNRNLITSSLEKGSYSVLTAGEGYSLPERAGNIQYRFGGSGMSYKESSHNIGDMITVDTSTGRLKTKFQGDEGFQFVFKVDKQLVELFPKLNLKEGWDIAVVHDNTLKGEGMLRVLGPHLDINLDGRNASQAAGMAATGFPASNKEIVRFEKFMQKAYNEVLDKVGEAFHMEGYDRLGQILMLLDGKNPAEYANIMNGDISLNSLRNSFVLGLESNATKNIEVKTTKSSPLTADAKPMTLRDIAKSDVGKAGNFMSVHLGKVDLRQPKIGLNDWVISKVEKLIDARRGPVQEMNIMDIINPQDADFDLDKSSSMFALPGRVVNDMYRASGYMSASDKVVEWATSQLKIDENLSQAEYASVTKTIEKQRAPLMRGNSVVGTLLHYFSFTEGSKNPRFNLFEVGESSNTHYSDRVENRKFKLHRMTHDNVEYHISLKQGEGLAGSINYIKDMIKATIDIYKGQQDISKIDINELIWTHDKYGLFKIQSSDKNLKNPIDITYAELPAKVKNQVDFLRTQILEPIGKLHNLQHMTEHFSDGTSKTMSPQQMVLEYESILKTIRNAGSYWDSAKNEYVATEFKGLTDNLITFLGGKINDKMSTPQSEMPVIKMLSALRKAQYEPFGSLKTDTGVGSILARESASPVEITRAIEQLFINEKNLASISVVQFRQEQIQDIIHSYVKMGKGDSKKAQYWVNELKRHDEIINRVNAKLVDANFMYKLGVDNFRAETSDGRPTKATEFVHIYRRNNKNEVFMLPRINPGEMYSWRKGDVVIENPYRMKAGNKNTTLVRHAMNDAFARVHENVDPRDMPIIQRLKSRFDAEMSEISNKLLDKNAPMTQERYQLLQSAFERTLADFVDQAGNIRSHDRMAYQQQFLQLLLSPKLDGSGKVYDIVGLDQSGKKLDLLQSYKSNKFNERLVIGFLNKAINGQANTVLDSKTAQNIFQEINDRFKVSLMKVWDGSLQGDAFQRFVQPKRDLTNFGFLNPMNDIPQWMVQKGLNKNARDIMQSYMTGTYFMDPVELYRMTMALDYRGAHTRGLPSNQTIGARIKYLWQGTDGLTYGGENGQSIFMPKHISRNIRGYGQKNTKDMGLENWMNNLKNTCGMGG